MLMKKTYIISLATLITVTMPVFNPSIRSSANSDELKADFILVIKKERKLFLLRQGKVVKEYRIALGRTPIGPKTEEGDGKTPEGRYQIDYRNPKSKFYLSLHISYPTEIEIRQAKMKGVSAGGDIMIHGLPNGIVYIGKSHLLRDWTDGCIAVTNEEIKEISDAVEIGTDIEIKP